jgi:hypothetical protein
MTALAVLVESKEPVTRFDSSSVILQLKGGRKNLPLQPTSMAPGTVRRETPIIKFMSLSQHIEWTYRARPATQTDPGVQCGSDLRVYQ